MASDIDMMLVVWRSGASTEQREIRWLLVRWRFGSAMAAAEAKAWRGG